MLMILQSLCDEASETDLSGEGTCVSLTDICRGVPLLHPFGLIATLPWPSQWISQLHFDGFRLLHH